LVDSFKNNCLFVNHLFSLKTKSVNSNAAINYANIPEWVALSFTSALSGYSQGQAVATTIGGNGVFNDAGRFLGSALSLQTAIGLTAGKIIFKWAQKPVVDCGC